MDAENALQSKAYIITESRVDNKTSIESLLTFLRVQRMTAHVNIQVVSGGVHQVIVTEKRKVIEKTVDKET